MLYSPFLIIIIEPYFDSVSFVGVLPVVPVWFSFFLNLILKIDFLFSSSCSSFPCYYYGIWGVYGGGVLSILSTKREKIVASEKEVVPGSQDIYSIYI